MQCFLYEHPAKKVYAVVDELAASAAYHIASATDEIYADDSSLIGSIGIISGGFGLEEAVEKLGLERRFYTRGENKAFLDPFAPVKLDQEAFRQQVPDALYDNFVADVKRGRGDRLSDDPDIFSGYIYNGERALELGLIDGLGSLRSMARNRTGIFVKCFLEFYKIQGNISRCCTNYLISQDSSISTRPLNKRWLW